MKWLLTGGCGFIGTALVKHLTSMCGHAVRVIDNLSVGSREDLAAVSRFEEVSPQDVENSTWSRGACQLVVGDILDQKLALQVASGSDVIVHLAANTGVAPSVESPRMDCVTNVIGTLNYLEAARLNSVKRFVFASSGAPVGECTPPIHEEIVPHPVSPYGASKLAGEGYCSAYFRTYGLETVALRFGNVYGPGSNHKGSVIAKFIMLAMRGERLEIYGDGRQTRDFIFIDDIVRAIWSAANTGGVGGDLFQIATGTETTLRELLELLVTALAENGIAEPRVTFSDRRSGDVSRNYSDTSKALRSLTWHADVDLGAGLRRTVDWFVHSVLRQHTAE